MPQTGWLMNNINLFLEVLEVGETKMKALADLVSGEGALPVYYLDVFSLCPHRWKGQRGSLSFFFFFCLFCLYRAAPMPYGGSQAKARVGTVAATLHHSHSHVGSKPRL